MDHGHGPIPARPDRSVPDRIRALTASAVVVGGGAVGLCVAEALATRGVSVTVIERDRCGRAASAGNAGWVTTALSAPVPGPGVVGQSLRWLVDPSGPCGSGRRSRRRCSPGSRCFSAAARGGSTGAGSPPCRRSPDARRVIRSPRASAARGSSCTIRSSLPGVLGRRARGAGEDRRAARRDSLRGIAATTHERGADSGLEPAISGRTIGGMVGSVERRSARVVHGRGARSCQVARGSVVEQTPAISLRRGRSGWIASGPTREWHADTVSSRAGPAPRSSSAGSACVYRSRPPGLQPDVRAGVHGSVTIDVPRGPEGRGQRLRRRRPRIRDARARRPRAGALTAPVGGDHGGGPRRCPAGNGGRPRRLGGNAAAVARRPAVHRRPARGRRPPCRCGARDARRDPVDDHRRAARRPDRRGQARPAVGRL